MTPLIASFALLLLKFQPVLCTPYQLMQSYTSSNFFEGFDFYSTPDPTGGFVQYVPFETAASRGLIGNNSGLIYLGVDSTNVYTIEGPGRPSVRLQSKLAFTEGLLVIDLTHTPVGCGTWPAFWTAGLGDWPADGEIDIIESANDARTNNAALHASGNCSVNATAEQTATWKSTNCSIAHDGNQGCSAVFTEPFHYGAEFNANGGGVYAMEWTSQAIRIWFFPRQSVPESLRYRNSIPGSPDSSTFGTPSVVFEGPCSKTFGEKFSNHSIIIDTTFCGGLAGGHFGSGASSCPLAEGLSPIDSCVDFVANNPLAFKDAYWGIRNLQVWEKVKGLIPESQAPEEPPSSKVKSLALMPTRKALPGVVSPFTGGVLFAGEDLGWISTVSASVSKETSGPVPPVPLEVSPLTGGALTLGNGTKGPTAPIPLPIPIDPGIGDGTFPVIFESVSSVPADVFSNAVPSSTIQPISNSPTTYLFATWAASGNPGFTPPNAPPDSLPTFNIWDSVGVDIQNQLQSLANSLPTPVNSIATKAGSVPSESPLASSLDTADTAKALLSLLDPAAQDYLVKLLDKGDAPTDESATSRQGVEFENVLDPYTADITSTTPIAAPLDTVDTAKAVSGLLGLLDTAAQNYLVKLLDSGATSAGETAISNTLLNVLKPIDTYRAPRRIWEAIADTLNNDTNAKIVDIITLVANLDEANLSSIFDNPQNGLLSGDYLPILDAANAITEPDRSKLLEWLGNGDGTSLNLNSLIALATAAEPSSPLRVGAQNVINAAKTYTRTPVAERNSSQIADVANALQAASASLSLALSSKQDRDPSLTLGDIRNQGESFNVWQPPVDSFGFDSAQEKSKVLTDLKVDGAVKRDKGNGGVPFQRKKRENPLPPPHHVNEDLYSWLESEIGAGALEGLTQRLSNEESSTQTKAALFHEAIDIYPNWMKAVIIEFYIQYANVAASYGFLEWNDVSDLLYDIWHAISDDSPTDGVDLSERLNRRQDTTPLTNGDMQSFMEQQIFAVCPSFSNLDTFPGELINDLENSDTNLVTSLARFQGRVKAYTAQLQSCSERVREYASKLREIGDRREESTVASASNLQPRQLQQLTPANIEQVATQLQANVSPSLESEKLLYLLNLILNPVPVSNACGGNIDTEDQACTRKTPFSDPSDRISYLHGGLQERIGKRALPSLKGLSHRSLPLLLPLFPLPPQDTMASKWLPRADAEPILAQHNEDAPFDEWRDHVSDLDKYNFGTLSKEQREKLYDLVSKGTNCALGTAGTDCLAKIQAAYDHAVTNDGIYGGDGEDWFVNAKHTAQATEEGEGKRTGSPTWQGTEADEAAAAGIQGAETGATGQPKQASSITDPGDSVSRPDSHFLPGGHASRPVIHTLPSVLESGSDELDTTSTGNAANNYHPLDSDTKYVPSSPPNPYYFDLIQPHLVESLRSLGLEALSEISGPGSTPEAYVNEIRAFLRNKWHPLDNGAREGLSTLLGPCPDPKSHHCDEPAPNPDSNGYEESIDASLATELGRVVKGSAPGLLDDTYDDAGNGSARHTSPGALDESSRVDSSGSSDSEVQGLSAVDEGEKAGDEVTDVISEKVAQLEPRMLSDPWPAMDAYLSDCHDDSFVPNDVLGDLVPDFEALAHADEDADVVVERE